jgi:hypothetical protein
MGRSFLAALLGAFVWMAIPDRADACVCVVQPVVANEPAGRVFTFDEKAGFDALAGAKVRLLRRDDLGVVAEATTDESGTFRLPTHATGRYGLEVSMLGFQTTGFYVELKKRKSRQPRGIAVRIDIGVGCTCGDACASAPADGGLFSSSCLRREAR